MALSKLQKYILRQCYSAKSKAVDKSVLVKFYDSMAVKPNADDMANIISKSVDRLVEKELAAGYGWKTSKRWYVSKVKLTAKGRKKAKSLFGVQQVLPLKNK